MRMVIKSSEWGRGEGKGFLHADGRFCCLGLHARACGIEVKDFDGQGIPSDIAPERVNVCYANAWLDFGISNDAAQAAWRINDTAATGDSEKIEELRPIFRSKGVTIIWRPDL